MARFSNYVDLHDVNATSSSVLLPLSPLRRRILTKTSTLLSTPPCPWPYVAHSLTYKNLLSLSLMLTTLPSIHIFFVEAGKAYGVANKGGFLLDYLNPFQC